jgi:hypothetical protein
MSLGTAIKYLIAAAALAVLGFYPKSFAAAPEPKAVSGNVSTALDNVTSVGQPNQDLA